MSRGRHSRVLVGLADQMVYSLTNFVVTLQVARHASAAQFGVYSLLMAASLVASMVNRGLTAEPVIVQHSSSDQAVWRRAVETKLWISLIFGEVFALTLLEVTQRIVPDEFSKLGLVFVLAPIAVFTQDFLRYAALAAKRPIDALANDIAVLIVQVAASAVLALLSSTGPEAAVLTWIGATACGCVVGLVRLRIGLRVPSRADLREDGGLAGRFAIDNLIAQLSQQGVTYIVATAGLAAAGGFRAAQTVYMPLAVLSLGVQSAVVPELARTRLSSPALMRKVTIWLAVASVVGCGLYVGVAAFTPEWLGRAVFGDSWAPAKPLIVLVGLSSVAGGLMYIAIAGLRAMADGTRTLRARRLSVVLSIVCVVPGALLGGARGAAIGLLVASWVQSVLWVRQLRASWLHDGQAAPGSEVADVEVRGGAVEQRALGRDVGLPAGRHADVEPVGLVE